LDIGYFAILQQMSGFAARIFGYFAISQQMSGFADRIFGYSAVVVLIRAQQNHIGEHKMPKRVQKHPQNCKEIGT
jgi:hypothetical protein